MKSKHNKIGFNKNTHLSVSIWEMTTTSASKFIRGTSSNKAVDEIKYIFI